MKKQCSWRNDDGVWKTECGLTLNNISDNLKDNNINFCPKCGLKISEMFPKQIEDKIDNCKICDMCSDKGKIYRDNDGWFKPTHCDCCGKIGPQLDADILNVNEIERNKGFWFNRVEFSIHEQAYYEVWADQNRPRPGLNGTISMVQLLISRVIQNKMFSVYGLKSIPENEVATERDYKVAATIIQFLGTNGGRFFLDEVKKKIKELEKIKDIK
jgi:hypothetical protein